LRQLLILFLACLLSCTEQELLPESPILTHEITNIKNNKFINPYIPAFRFSGDGRIALSTKKMKGRIQFFLMTPEKVEGDFNLDPKANENILASNSPFNLLIKKYGSIKNYWHNTLCDPSEFDTKVKKNPYVCSNNKDCYDLELITVGEIKAREKYQLVSLPIRVIVSNPKSKKAQIESVKIRKRQGSKDNYSLGPVFKTFNFFEPLIVGDGRLVVTRQTVSDLVWPDTAGKLRKTEKVNLTYSVYKNGKACDVEKWKQFYPISYAHKDTKNEMSKRYGFARFPFRDHLGLKIPSGKEIGGSYHWIDRKAKNVFFTTMYSNRKLYFEKNGKVKSRYEVRCIDGTDCFVPKKKQDLYTTENGPHGYSIFGLWTNGKMIYLDGDINNSDYALRATDDQQKMIKLYSGKKEWIRVGAVRDNRTLDDSSKGRVHNSTFLDSLEERLNYKDSMKPKTPRDVVWKVSSGVATDEIVFDDYINPNTIIFAEMTGALEYKVKGENREWTSFDYLHNDLDKNGEARKKAYLQNSSTSYDGHWKVPRYGVLDGSGRIEPVSLGGIRGKGLWLEDKSKLIFNIPKQTREKLYKRKSKFLGIFLDLRKQKGSRGTLFSFSKNNKIILKNGKQIIFHNGKNILEKVNLPISILSSGWNHIAIKIEKEKTKLFHNGMLVKQTNKIRLNNFDITEGSLTVGESIRGWVDEFKFLLGDQSQELICNHARGTLIHPNTNKYWRKISNKYQHKNIACYTKYDEKDVGLLSSIPIGAISLREKLTFPEGPLVYNQPRPSSMANNFCIRCHTRNDIAGDSLSLKALSAGSKNGKVLLMEHDKRQPMQPPAIISGNIPKDFFGKNNPNTTLKLKDKGEYIDSFLHSSKGER
jgi:hypothetical protein